MPQRTCPGTPAGNLMFPNYHRTGENGSQNTASRFKKQASQRLGIREHFDAPSHLPAADQEFLINLRVAEHDNPDGAPFAQAGNRVMVYGA